MLDPRGLTRDQAAAYCGVSAARFDQGRERGEYPQPTLPAGRYDRRLIDLALDRLSGLAEVAAGAAPAAPSPDDVLQAWLDEQAGKATR
jgi:hypothetical protein